jgi:hypothetical protein
MRVLRLQRCAKGFSLIANGGAPSTLVIAVKKMTANKELSMIKTYAGDKVIRDAATVNQGNVCLGDCAPVFRPIRAGDKVHRDTTTENQGKVCMGDCAPVFRR